MKRERSEHSQRCFHRARARITLLIALFFAAHCPLAAAENVHLYGALVAEPCVILPGDQEIQLDFGTIIDKYLYLNKRTNGLSFDIHLSECDSTLASSVRIVFRGTESNALPGLLAVNAGSRAKGIAIGFETSEAKPLPINKPSDKSPLQAGSHRITLNAYVQGEPQAIAGRSIALESFSVTATFSFEYH